MGSKDPKVFKLPQEQKQQTTNTYAPFSVAGTQEAKDFLAAPLDFGKSYADLNTDVDIDPGVGHRTALAEQGVRNRYGSAFNAGLPAWLRQMNEAKEVRDVQAQGASEAQQAEYGRQTARRGLEFRKAELVEGANRDRELAELERRRLLLGQFLPTGGTGSSTGFSSTLGQPQPGFLQRLAIAGVQGAAQGATGLFGGGG